MKKSEAERLATEAKKRKTTEALKFVFFGSCTIFTALAMLFLSPQLFTHNDLIDPLRFFLIYPFSLCVTIGSLIFKVKKAHILLKLLVHFSVIAVSFYVFLCSTLSNADPFILIALLGLIYAIVAIAILSVLRITRKKEEKPAYVSMFSQSSKK